MKHLEYYKRLEISPDQAVDAASLKTQYAKMARKYHPDKNPQDPKGAEENFRKVSEGTLTHTH